jgi:hypothetical protein
LATTVRDAKLAKAPTGRVRRPIEVDSQALPGDCRGGLSFATDLQ